MILKTKLEDAGYSCWMDIGQIGGGDQLDEQIDKGIRACKVSSNNTLNKSSVKFKVQSTNVLCYLGKAQRKVSGSPDWLQSCTLWARLGVETQAYLANAEVFAVVARSCCPKSGSQGAGSDHVVFQR